METTDIEDLAQHFSGLRLHSPTSTTSATSTHKMSDSPSDKTEDDCCEGNFTSNAVTVMRSPPSSFSTQDSPTTSPPKFVSVQYLSTTPQIVISTSSNTDDSISIASDEPVVAGASADDGNLVNLNNVDNIEDWIISGEGRNEYIGREVDNEKFQCAGSKWGNPFKLSEYKSRKKVVDLFREYLLNNQELLDDIGELEGKVLGCWCHPLLCHGKVLHEFAGNSPQHEAESVGSSPQHEHEHEHEHEHVSSLTPSSST